MKRQRLTFILVLGAMLALVGFFVRVEKNAQAETGYQRSLLSGGLQTAGTFDAEKCRILLQKTAGRLGWPNPEIYVNDYGSESTCQMSFIGSQDGIPFKIDVQITVQAGWCDDCAYYCESSGNQNNCKCVDIHGLPGRLTLPRDNQGTFLTFCDPYCSLVFRVTTQADNNQMIDPQPAADALYYSALEINCCQVVEAVPPVDVQPTEDILPPVADNPPGDPLPPIVDNPPEVLTTPSEPLSKSPVVPLIGALIGTLVGWLVSVVVTNASALKTSLAAPVQPGAASIPPAGLPNTWDEWERSYISHEIPAYRGPDVGENSSVHISVEDAKNAVLRSFFNDLPDEGKTRVANANMRKVEDAEFDAEYLKVFPKDSDYQKASAFVDPATGKILVCTSREINYTPVHELMHVASNSEFKQLTNEAMDEAVTEFFTHRIADQRKVVRSSEYDVSGSTDVVAEIVKSHGEDLLRQAYFQPGRQGYDQLRQAVDRKLGTGAFEKTVQLMGRPAAPPKQMALDLLRGRGIRRN